MVSHVDVWVMKVYGVKEFWTNILTIEYPDDPFVDYDYMISGGRIMCSLVPSSVSIEAGTSGTISSSVSGASSVTPLSTLSSIVMTYSTSLDKKSNIMTYNPKDGSFRYSKVINFNFDGWRMVGIYVETLVCPLSAEGRKNATKSKAGKTQ
ncbi:hypothetical protein H5410_016303, partial [Solanum commersonii]